MTVFPLTGCGVLYYVDQLHTNVNNTENLPPSQKQSYNLIGPFEFQNLLQIRYTGQVGSFNLPGIMTQNRVNTKGKSKSSVQYAMHHKLFFVLHFVHFFFKGELGISTEVWYIIVWVNRRCMVAQFNKQKIKAIDGRSLPIWCQIKICLIILKLFLSCREPSWTFSMSVLKMCPCRCILSWYRKNRTQLYLYFTQKKSRHFSYFVTHAYLNCVKRRSLAFLNTEDFYSYH